MKFAIFSDIHSNPEAFFDVLRDAKEQGVTTKEQRILLGDIVGYGHAPLFALQLALDTCGIVLKGNHEAGLIGEIGLDWFSYTSKEALVRQRGVLNDAWRKWMGDLPYRYSKPLGHFLAAHGSYDAAEEFNYVDNPVDIAMEFARMRAGTDKSCRFNVDFLGHTHSRMAIAMDGKTGKIEVLHDAVITIQPDQYYIFNVGSVGYPRVDRFVSYVIYDTDASTVTYRKLPFDFKGYAERLEANGIPTPLWLEDELERMERNARESEKKEEEPK